MPAHSRGLDGIRNDLIRQEETIIFGLIERSQYAHNKKVYTTGGFPLFAKQSGNHSFMEYFLLETEKLHAMCSRYQCPDENPFFPDKLPVPVLAPVSWPQVLAPNTVNVNSRIMTLYLEKVVPRVCGGEGTDDEQYGSTAVCDINVLQAISKRVHFGKFVAEAKFQAETEKYKKLIAARDSAGIMEALTNRVVEERLLRRVRHKAQTYGSEIEDEGRCEDATLKVEPDVIVEIYRDILIPLTKEVEVDYLLRRCGPLPVAFVGGVSGCMDAAKRFWQLDNPDSGIGPVSVSPIVPHAFEEVRAGRAAYACVPLEISETGVVKATVNEFKQEVKRRKLEGSGDGPVTSSTLAVGEVYVPAAFALLSKEGVEPREVAGEAQFLHICQDALEAKHKGLVRTPVVSTAEAIERAKASEYVAAIVPDDGSASQEVGSGMKRQRLESRTVNHFLIVGPGPCPVACGKDRTLVLFSLKDAAGSLVEALKAFESFGVNLSSIHSFSKQSHEDEHILLLKAEGHQEDVALSRALEAFGKCPAVQMCSVIGSFPAASRSAAVAAPSA